MEEEAAAAERLAVAQQLDRRAAHRRARAEQRAACKLALAPSPRLRDGGGWLVIDEGRWWVMRV